MAKNHRESILKTMKRTISTIKNDFFFLTLSFIFTSFREQDEAYINSLRWSALVNVYHQSLSPIVDVDGRREWRHLVVANAALVGLEPAYTRM